MANPSGATTKLPLLLLNYSTQCYYSQPLMTFFLGEILCLVNPIKRPPLPSQGCLQLRSDLCPQLRPMLMQIVVCCPTQCCHEESMTHLSGAVDRLHAVDKHCSNLIPASKVTSTATTKLQLLELQTLAGIGIFSFFKSGFKQI